MRTFEIHAYTGERIEVFATGSRLDLGTYIVERANGYTLYPDQDTMFELIRQNTPVVTDLYLVWDDVNTRKQLAARVTPLCDEIIKTCNDADLDDDMILERVYRLALTLPQLVR